MFLLHFLYNWLILFNSYSYCTNVLTAELLIPTGTQANKANTQTETQPVTVETEISKCSTYLNTYMSSYIFHSLNYYVLFILKGSFLLHQFFSI